MQAGQQAALETVGGSLGQVVRFEHPPHADVTAGLAAGCWAEQANAALLEQRAVGLGRGVGPHGLVHRRGQCHRCVGSQDQGGQQVVGHALCQTRHEIGRGGCDQHQVGPARQLDMPHGRFGGRIEQIEMDRVAGKGLEGQRGDEFAPAVGHHDADLGTLVAQPANQLGALVRGDAAADAQDDAFTIKPLHRPALLRVRTGSGHGRRPRLKGR